VSGDDGTGGTGGINIEILRSAMLLKRLATFCRTLRDKVRALTSDPGLAQSRPLISFNSLSVPPSRRPADPPSRRPAVSTLHLALLLAGCVYERIDILVGGDTYNGTILSSYDAVEVTKTGIVIKPGGRLAIKTPYVTQVLAQMEVTILEGSGMNAYLRTVANRFDTTHGIAFRYAVDGCQIRLADGRVVPLYYNAETEKQTVSFYHEASLLTISVGCQRLYEGESELPATEYLILETLPGSTIEIRTINFHETNTK
jgi:hypothetical protein